MDMPQAHLAPFRRKGHQNSMVIGASARVTAIKSLESFRVLESWQVGMAGEEDFSGKRSCHSEGRRKQICHARAKPELRTDVTPKRTGQVFDRLLVAARTSTVLTHQTSFLLHNISYLTWFGAFLFPAISFARRNNPVTAIWRARRCTSCNRCAVRIRFQPNCI